MTRKRRYSTRMLLLAIGFAPPLAWGQAPASAPVAQLSFSEKPSEDSSAPPRILPVLEASPLTPRDPAPLGLVQTAGYKDIKKTAAAADLDPPTAGVPAKDRSQKSEVRSQKSEIRNQKSEARSQTEHPVTRLPDTIEDCGRADQGCRRAERWKLFCGGSLCATDPCYEPCWEALADAAFYTAAVRPQSQIAIRYNHMPEARLLDRSEYMWARADGLGRGPTPPAGFFTVPQTRWHEASLYVEGATTHFGVILEVPYRSLDLDPAGHFAGFADLRAGVKSIVYDTEMLQIGLQLLATIPTASAGKGLGVDHTSLEPSVLFGLRVTPSTFIQGQVAEWIPLGGDRDYAAALLHGHTSVNQVVARFGTTSVLATGEFQAWCFQDGAYTDPNRGFMPANDYAYLSAGPGVRVVLGEKIDLGVAAALGLNSPHFAAATYTAAFRWRF